jgi:hypothetical protein
MPVISNIQSPGIDALPDPCTAKEFGAVFRRQPETVHRWRKAGYIRSVAGTGNRLYPKSELIRRLEQLTPSECY